MDDVAILIKRTVSRYDDDMNRIYIEEERQVFCQVHGITRTEFYAAAVADLHPEIVLRLSDYLDYQGEDLVKYHDELYSVIRTYRDRSGSSGGMDQNAIELILTKKVGNGNG